MSFNSFKTVQTRFVVFILTRFAIASVANNVFGFRESVKRQNLAALAANFLASTNKLQYFFRGHCCNFVAPNFMKAVVRSGRHNLQVFNSIVRFVAIDVVNLFRSLKFSAQMLFHNIPVLPHLFTINVNEYVAELVGVFTTIRSFFQSQRIPMPYQTQVMFVAITTSTRRVFTVVNRAFSHSFTVAVSKGGHNG